MADEDPATVAADDEAAEHEAVCSDLRRAGQGDGARLVVVQ